MEDLTFRIKLVFFFFFNSVFDDFLRCFEVDNLRDGFPVAGLLLPKF